MEIAYNSKGGYQENVGGLVGIAWWKKNWALMV
jgi:hypothetical protein